MIGDSLIIHCMNGNKLVLCGENNKEVAELYDEIILGMDTSKVYVKHKYAGREYIIVLDKICSLEYVKVAV